MSIDGVRPQLAEVSRNAMARIGSMSIIPRCVMMTARMNDCDPQAWLAGVLARIADHAAQELDEYLPWSRQSRSRREAV